MVKDSGNRTMFESGAVRDMHEGKGRCDLLPAWQMLNFLNAKDPLDAISYVVSYMEDNDIDSLYKALDCFCREAFNNDPYKMMLELAIHFEDGAKKYGDNNWKKGVPQQSYLDSAIRHYLKYKSFKLNCKEMDERHDRAFVWNIICLIWSLENGIYEENGEEDEI